MCSSISERAAAPGLRAAAPHGPAALRNASTARKLGYMWPLVPHGASRSPRRDAAPTFRPHGRLLAHRQARRHIALQQVQYFVVLEPAGTGLLHYRRHIGRHAAHGCGAAPSAKLQAFGIQEHKLVIRHDTAAESSGPRHAEARRRLQRRVRRPRTAPPDSRPPQLGGRPCGCTRPWNSSRRPGRAPPRGRGAGGCSGWEAGGVRFGPTAPPPLLGDPRLALSTAGCRTGGAGARLASSGGGGSPRGPRGPPLAADGPRIRVWARGGALPPAGVLFPSRAPAGANWWPSGAQAWHNWGSWSPRGGVEGGWLAPMQRAPGGWTQAAKVPPRLLSACWPAFCSMEHCSVVSCPLRLARGNGDLSSGGAGATPHPVPRRPQPNHPRHRVLVHWTLGA